MALSETDKHLWAACCGNSRWRTSVAQRDTYFIHLTTSAKQLLATPPRWHELSQKENREAITLDVPMCPFSHFRGMLWGSGAGIRNLSSFFCVCWAWSKVKIFYNFISWLSRKRLKVFFQGQFSKTVTRFLSSSTERTTWISRSLLLCKSTSSWLAHWAAPQALISY